MKACRQTRRLLELQFAGDLSWKQELQLTDHLSGCSECAAAAQAQGHVLESLSVYREAPLAKIDVDRFVQKVQDRIAAEPVGQAAEVESARPSKTKWIALAAAIPIVASLSWVLRDKFAAPADMPGEIVSPSVIASPELAKVSEPTVIPAAVDNQTFQAERHQAAVTDLRGALASLMGDAPDWALYGDRVEGLRTAGWPMASLLSGLLSDPHLKTAQAAVLALGQEGGRLAQRRLWGLRKDERLGGIAVAELQARDALTIEHTVQLYWEGTYESVALTEIERWHDAQALRGAQQILDEAPQRRIPDSHYPVLANALAQSGSAGCQLALDWLQQPCLDQQAWAIEVARSVDLSEVLTEYLANDAGSAWEAGAMALAAHHKSEAWVPFLSKRCIRSRSASQAVQLLATQPGLPAFELLLAQETNRMVKEDVWLDAWSQAVQLDSARLVALAQSYRSRATRSELEHFADVLLIGDQPGTGAALVELALAPDLSDRLRSTLVLRAGRMGEPSAIYGLETLFGGLTRKDASLAACVLIALVQLGEASHASALLELQTPATSQASQAILALCDPQSRRSERERRYLIARKLKSILGKRNLSSLE
ncbi:MAG: hypothetical protein ACI9X4_001915 [Glaciecola sp.]|jgi:hypothetical protein